jgi:deazaflavin-dependent oxidoreductase (nitroreductase family)
MAALSYLRDGDRLLVLGSNFGQQHHPAWSANLLADPEAVVAISGTEIPLTATLLTGPERDGALQGFLTYPMYTSYRTRTDRELRVFALARRCPARPDRRVCGVIRRCGRMTPHTRERQRM